METLATVKKEQNISVIQKAFENFLNGQITDILNECTEDVEWSSYHNPAIPFAKTYYGKKGTAEFFATLAASTDYKIFEPREYYADRDSVLVRGYQEATVKATGKNFSHDFLMHFKLRDGKVFQFFAFVDTRDESEAFGH